MRKVDPDATPADVCRREAKRGKERQRGRKKRGKEREREVKREGER